MMSSRPMKVFSGLGLVLSVAACSGNVHGGGGGDGDGGGGGDGGEVQPCSETCRGCCTADDVCIQNTTPSLCGIDGQQCFSCPATQFCTDQGTCDACNASTCDGCCTAEGDCGSGVRNDACGNTGAACAVCDAGQECDWQRQCSTVISEVGSWPMAGANAHRTSWSPEEVVGGGYETLKVEWYQTLEPFVHHAIPVVAGEDKVFVSTAKGLFAFDAGTGANLWVYGTDLPLGHAPTLYSHVLYVGGMDRRIHAINASDGQLRVGWTFVEAGAGFETNPLVISSRVYAGNRDGYFYCLSAQDGSLIWKWRDEDDEYPDAPIRYSAAHQGGVFYFASDNAHAYAIRDLGDTPELVWKSDQLPGVGFSTYWPVVYTHPDTGNDYVLFSGTKKEAAGTSGSWFAESYYQENYQIMSTVPQGSLVDQGNPTTATQLDVSLIQNYFAQNPHKRHLFVLDAQTGIEPAMQNGQAQDFAPVSWVSVTHGGNKYPPVVHNGLVLTHMGYSRINSGGGDPNGGAAGGIAGWKVGSSTVERYYDFERGFADEPITFTAGGNVIYWVEGFNMGYGLFGIDQPFGSNQVETICNVAGIWGCWGIPGYDQQYAECDVYGGTCTGVYSAMPSAFYPYKGRLYLIERNALLAIGPAGGQNQVAPMLSPPPPTTPPATALPATELTARLENEVQKILDAGHLRPGFHDSGLWGGRWEGASDGDHLPEYHHNPGVTVYTLLQAMAYVPAAMQADIRNYITQYYGYLPATFSDPDSFPYDFTQIAHVGWKRGQPREIYIDPPTTTAFLQRPESATDVVGRDPRSYSQETNVWDFPPLSVYAAWKYAQTFEGDSAGVLDRMRTKFEPQDPSDAAFQSQMANFPYLLNAHLAAYHGYIELSRMQGEPTAALEGTYDALLALRSSQFDRDTYLDAQSGWTYEFTLNIGRNFIYLVPEVAERLRAQSGFIAKVQSALSLYHDITPYWFVSKFDQTFGEGAYHPLYDYQALFMAHAYLAGTPYDELVQYLDVPAFYRGDLYYIQRLVAALSVAP